MTDSSGEGLQVSLFGPLDVRLAGARVGDRSWRTAKAKELFAVLVTSQDRALGRDEIIELLWPESDRTRAVSNFHFTLHSLRRALAATDAASAPIIRSDGGYQLVTRARVPVDVDTFELLLREANAHLKDGYPENAVRLLRGALAIHRAPFLADLEGAWIERRREELTRQYLSAARQLAELEMAQRDWKGAIEACVRFLEHEPYEEQMHRTLLRAYHASGDTALVRRHYDALAATLRRELGEEPERATTDLYLRLRGDARLGPAPALPFTARQPALPFTARQEVRPS